MAPVLGITAGTWVLPDGPLFAALLGYRVLLGCGPAIGWRAAGAGGWRPAVCAGLALCSKYSAVLTLIGAAAFLVTEPMSRRWLTRPHPYIAGGRSAGDFLCRCWSGMPDTAGSRFRFREDGPAVRSTRFGRVLAVAGQAVFLLPWIWAPLLWCGLAALRRGPSDRERWLLVCLAAPPILVFTAAALWGKPSLSLGSTRLSDAAAAARRGTRPSWQTSRSVRIWLRATATFVILGLGLVASEVRLNWLPGAGRRAPGPEKTRTLMSWIGPLCERNSSDRGFLDRPGLIVATLKWHEAGKIDYALGGRVPVICLGPDPRQYGLYRKP